MRVTQAIAFRTFTETARYTAVVYMREILAFCGGEEDPPLLVSDACKWRDPVL